MGMITRAQNDGPDPPANFTMSDYWSRAAAWKECRVPVWMQKQPPRCISESSLHTQSPGDSRKADHGRPRCPVQGLSFGQVFLDIQLLPPRSWLRAWPCLAPDEPELTRQASSRGALVFAWQAFDQLSHFPRFYINFLMLSLEILYQLHSDSSTQTQLLCLMTSSIFNFRQTFFYIWVWMKISCSAIFPHNPYVINTLVSYFRFIENMDLMHASDLLKVYTN